MLLANAGHVAQETLKTAWFLRRAGCAVTFLALHGGNVRLDPLCDALAAAEAVWDPTLRLRFRARREGWLRDLPSIAELHRAQPNFVWLDSYDAVVVPGGHGSVFGAFLRDQRIIDAVAYAYQTGRTVGLLCHGPVVGALPSTFGPAILQGQAIACWPRLYETALGLLPGIGRYFVPAGQPVGRLAAQAGAEVHDAVLPGRRRHAMASGRLVTGRGPWSIRPFTDALLAALQLTGRPLVEAVRT